jgi:hypothetical protein
MLVKIQYYKTVTFVSWNPHGLRYMTSIKHFDILKENFATVNMIISFRE